MKKLTWDNLRLSVDAEGVALLAMDVAGREANVFTAGFIADWCAAVSAIATDADIRGVIVASDQPGGFARGADPADLLAVHEAGLTPLQIRDILAPMARSLRDLERCGKPVAAAIQGAALAGGFELALACHHRVLADDDDAVLGLPEVRYGLLPGGGGTQRLPRLIGITAALPLLLSGRSVPPQEALSTGLVQALRPRDEVVRAARHWVLSMLSAGEPVMQPWDAKGYRLPGGAGAMAPHAPGNFGVGMAQVRMATHDREPAPMAILSCVYEGTQLPLDKALAIEGRYFAALLADPVARNRLRTMEVQARRWRLATGGRPDAGSSLALQRLAKAVDDEGRAQQDAGVPAALRANAARQVGWADVPKANAQAPQEGGWPIDDLRAAWLVAPALEAARCLEEGVVSDPAWIDVPAVLEGGFPAWTGGPLSYIDTLGWSAFIAQCERLSALLGRRYLPSPWLKAWSESGRPLYPRSTGAHT